MDPLIALVLLYNLAVSTSDGSFLGPHDNLLCEPRPAVVAVDPVNHGSFPIFVTLHRCQGSVGHIQPSVLKCVRNRYAEVRVMNMFTRQHITLRNHTSCIPACAKTSCDPDSLQHFNSNSCNCDCKYKAGPPAPCGQGYKWSPDKCKCQCNRVPPVCTGGKVWSHNQCRCECNQSAANQQCKRNQILDRQTCKCVTLTAPVKHGQHSNTSTHMFITLLVLEAVVIAILLTALIHWVRKKGPVDSTYPKASAEESAKPLKTEGNEYRLSNFGADSGQ